MTINCEGTAPLFLISRFARVNQRAADAICAEIIKRESNPVLLSPYSYARGGGVKATSGSLVHGAVSVLGSYPRPALNTQNSLDSSTADWARTSQVGPTWRKKRPTRMREWSRSFHNQSLWGSHCSLPSYDTVSPGKWLPKYRRKIPIPTSGSWIPRQYVPPRCWYPPTKLHGVIAQKTRM
jgi:hypothetical protein